MAASAENANIVQKLIEQGHDVNAKDEKGNTALFYASTKEIVKILLDEGTSSEVEHEYLYSPIHYAATIGNKKLFTFYLKKMWMLILKMERDVYLYIMRLILNSTK
ncbi:ankyrin repeat domain-containing protein [Candidatus Rickettsia tasmanensis]